MFENLFRVDGKVAVVMGGAGGIGRTLAEALSWYGANVVISDIRLDAAEVAAKEIKAATGKETLAVASDVTKEESIAQLVKAVTGKFGTVDILVNAMGINIKHDAVDYPIEDWYKMFSVNVHGTMITCKQFGRVFKEKKDGHIINLSSVRGIRGYTGGNSGYCATKGSVEMITKCLAIEWAPYNIHVNALGPALIITPGTIHIQKDPELAKKRAAQIPLGRLGFTEDLVGACIFLASGASDFVTGQTLYVDGGTTAI
jgi:gluconate 5-dehydrogenase